MAEEKKRAGYTVTMFVIDISPSMGAIRTVETETSNGQVETVEMTHLQYGLQYVKLKIQDMIYNGRKTDQCGVIVFGSEDTRNIVASQNGGYENITEYIPIAQPNANTLAKIDALEPSDISGDPIDALIVAFQTQNKELVKKKSWTRKITLITDGESPIEVEDWEATVNSMNELNIDLAIVGIDFDDENLPFTESNKSSIKRANEEFYRKLTSRMKKAIMGTCEYALQQTYEPEPRIVHSKLSPTTLRIGDVNNTELQDQAIELSVKTAKCTSMARPKAWKKYMLRANKIDSDAMPVDEDKNISSFASLQMRTQFLVITNAADEDEDGDVEMTKEDDDALLDANEDDEKPKNEDIRMVEKEELVRGFKYGTTYVPCPDGQFKKLETQKGIDIIAFLPLASFRREWSMGEIQYVWADNKNSLQQVALSSIVQAMAKKRVYAIARWVSSDGMDPKMGVLAPVETEDVHYFLWAQMPFADDVRKYSFASLNTLTNKKGEVITEHPYLPNQEQLDAMDDFVDAMDLMKADKDEEGNRRPWFQTIDSYNPAVHRVKQAMFHCAVVNDIITNPLPSPHPELTKYFDPPRKVVKKAQLAIDACKSAFNVKEVPKRVAREKKDEHAHANDDDDDMLLLDGKPPVRSSTSEMNVVETGPSSSKVKAAVPADDSETEDDDDEDLLLNKGKPSTPSASNHGGPLPTPTRSVSPTMVDPQRVPGRVVGNTYPLKDFLASVEQDDLVSKAVEDLSAIILEVASKPFFSRRSDEMVECMITLRHTCLAENQVMAWNSFLHDLKKLCLSKLGNAEFWHTIQEHGRDLSLISDQEANNNGSQSLVTDNEAGEFMS